jgi:hypothetical protein
MSLTTQAGIEFQIDVLDADGATLRSLPKRRNVILNQGLDRIGAGKTWTDVISYVAAGTGALVTKRASGSVTVSASAGTLTASAGYFVAADVGRIFKFDTGQECTITAYTSATVVTTSNTATIAAAAGTLHCVNLTTLVTETDRSSTVSTALSQSWDSANSTLTFSITLLTPILTTARVYSEIGWSDSSSGNLFGCAPISPSQSLGIGQRLKVTINLALVVGPTTPTALNGSGLNVGSQVIGGLSSAYPAHNAIILSPTVATGPYLFTTPLTLANTNFGTSSFSYGTSMSPSTYTLNTYVSGSYTRSAAWYWADTKGAITAYGMYLSYNYAVFQIRFTTPIEKTANDRIDATFTWSWGRTLVN